MTLTFAIIPASSTACQKYIPQIFVEWSLSILEVSTALWSLRCVPIQGNVAPAKPYSISLFHAAFGIVPVMVCNDLSMHLFPVRPPPKL